MLVLTDPIRRGLVAADQVSALASARISTGRRQEFRCRALRRSRPRRAGRLLVEART